MRKISAGHYCVKPVFCRMHRRERIFSVFTNDVYFTKLDIVGSMPARTVLYDRRKGRHTE
jgi:hypothetical protein